MKKYLIVRSRNKTANLLRRVIDTKGRDVILRLGSQTPTTEIIKNRPIDNILEINSPGACKISGNKILMKNAFDKNGVITAKWWNLDDYNNIDTFPIIIKHINSSRGKGIYLINNKFELDNFIKEKNINNNYVAEVYHTYTREYRLHVTKDGCFYSCRKMLKHDAEERWHRHDVNSVWVLEENPLFDKPFNWSDIINECINAMNSCGLDICAVDIKVQSSKFNNPKFIILETNSAPSLGEITAIKYIEQLNKMINNDKG